jgi:hypothetical protein
MFRLLSSTMSGRSGLCDFSTAPGENSHVMYTKIRPTKVLSGVPAAASATPAVTMALRLVQELLPVRVARCDTTMCRGQ